MNTKVLLAEDNPVDQMVIRTMLTKLGCDVDIVENGFLAVDALGNKRYDIVFMDKVMPVLDGIEASRMIRELHADLNVPIIIVSAETGPEDFVETYAIGIQELIAKPVAMYKFQAVLEKFNLKMNSCDIEVVG